MNIEFKAFTKEDVPLYYKWCDKPHVKEKWFREGYEPKESILDKIDGDGSVVPFVIKIDNNPIGYIQYYRIGDSSWNALQDQSKDTLGFDIFIGQEDYVGKGYGNKVVYAFVEMLFALPDIKKIIVDPFADDARAIGCYKKAGFSFLRNDIDDTGSKIYIMEKCK